MAYLGLADEEDAVIEGHQDGYCQKSGIDAIKHLEHCLLILLREADSAFGFVRCAVRV